MVVKGKNTKKVGGQRRPSPEDVEKKQPEEKRMRKEEEKEEVEEEEEKETTTTESTAETTEETKEEKTTEGMGKEEVKEAAEAEEKVGAEESALTTQTIETFDGLSQPTRRAIREMGFTHLTRIQAASLPPLMRGKDLLGKAATGSGKSLSFLIPAVELLYGAKFVPRNGTGAIVLSPTRELALQLYQVVVELMRFFTQTHGVVIGGASRKTEEGKLCKGVNLLVATPGRLLDHLHNTRGFVFKNLKLLVIDEADRIMAQGFEEEMHQILRLLPRTRQTVLFSATMTDKVEDIARLSLTEPVFVDVDGDRRAATVETLEQGYVVTESDMRFRLLFTFLKKNLGKKIIVFFSSCASVKFHAELLNYIDIPVLELHGQQKQNKRTSTFFEFCHAEKGILLTTDVAARGLDIPAVDWIIQYDPPDTPADDIHRVGRTARMGSTGRALVFLLPSELAFLSYLKAARVPLNLYEFSENKIAKVQAQLEHLIEKNYYLNKSAREAFRSYIQAYASHSLKDIFDIHKLDLTKVARSFGFSSAPSVNLSFLSGTPDKYRPRGGGKGYGSGSAGHNNPKFLPRKGVIGSGSKGSRQFIRG